MLDLPIAGLLPRLSAALRDSRSVILSAPPGAGKTTRIPLALRGAEWARDRKLLMLEPRRLAARRAADYMASTLGERVGETVGYRIRGETRVGRRTRIEVVTEGVLTRIIQQDTSLAEYALVIFDEYHERSIHADLGLALVLDAQTHLRPDLRILAMSATLNGLALADLLGQAPVLEVSGRTYPVDIRYLISKSSAPLESRVSDAVVRSLETHEGDILVFLPGQAEIKRTESRLLEKGLPDDVVVYLLYGAAGYEQQTAALAPEPQGRRKVILATSIAETSITIDGIRVVIDSGLARRSEFDPRRGMAGLVTGPVSRAIADQRSGRAGRQSPGVSYRLWTEGEQPGLPAFPSPEILSTDLAPLALDLALWGTPFGEGLRFIDPPPPAHLQQARRLLTDLGALDDAGKLTPSGKMIASLPVHPRTAYMMLRGKALRLGNLACDVGALLEEQGGYKGPPGEGIELGTKLQSAFDGTGRRRTSQLVAQADRLRALLGVEEGTDKSTEDALGILLALAYPERIAKRRDAGGTRYQLANGTGAVLPAGSPLAREEYLAVGDVDGTGTEVRIFLAEPIRQETLEEVFADRIKSFDEVRWDSQTQMVVARRIRGMGSIAFRESPLHAEGEAILSAMLEGIRGMGLQSLPWGKDSTSLRGRSEWLRREGVVSTDWPDFSDAALERSLRDWLGPFLQGVTRRDHLNTLDLQAILRSRFSHPQLRELDRLAPSQLSVPGGSRIRIDYHSGPEPFLAVRLQEMFGETDTPTIAGGRCPLLLHLLSPAGRPLAVTRDLRSFWLNTYPALRKEMRARYPRHEWPEDPFAARPTNRPRRRKRT